MCICVFTGGVEYVSYCGYSQKSKKGTDLGLHEVSVYISEQNLNFNLEKNPQNFNRPFDYKEKD